MLKLWLTDIMAGSAENTSETNARELVRLLDEWLEDAESRGLSSGFVTLAVSLRKNRLRFLEVQRERRGKWFHIFPSRVERDIMREFQELQAYIVSACESVRAEVPPWLAKTVD